MAQLMMKRLLVALALVFATCGRALPAANELSPFAPAAAYSTPQPVSASSARAVMPAGVSTIVVYNLGPADAYVTQGNAGITATTADDFIGARCWMSFQSGSAAYLAAITGGGTTTLNISGGSGLPTGSGCVAAPKASTGAYASATAGASDVTILAANGAQSFLDVVNQSPTQTVCLNFGAAATISGTSCAAGEITLPPLWHRSWEGGFVPSDALHAIASAASTPLSVGAK
jgi:hypothetical protein